MEAVSKEKDIKVHYHLLRLKYSLEISSLISEPPQSILPCQMRQNTRNLKKMCNLIQSDIYISINAGSIWGGGVGPEMEKRADNADISVLFFGGCANFLAVYAQTN